MLTSKINVIFIKTIIAIVLISILIGIASTDMAPNMSLASVLIACIITIAIFFIVLIFSIISGASSNQNIIRRGGTDPAWLWFDHEPPGLEKQRTELKEFEENKL
jgi:hypothetical protein